jgi:hypothetical protein
MRAPKLLWFVFWRMALWGLGLGLGLGAAYGTLVGMPFYPFGLIFGPLLGAMYGTIAGFPLGLLEGMVLGAVTMLLHRRGAPDHSLRYRRAPELACVMACILAVTTFWGVVFWRDRDSTSVRLAFTRDLLEALVLVVVPLLIATGASWWAGARVAKRYVDELGDPVTCGFDQATGKNAKETEL